MGGISLREPELGDMSVMEALDKRRSRREFKKKAITEQQLSNLLWAAQGVTDKRGFRTSPSAGASYPLTLNVIVHKAGGLSQGVYEYLPKDHEIVLKKEGWFWDSIREASFDQGFISDAAVILVLTGDPSKLKRRYGERGRQYMHNEVGHVGQNVHLACESMGLGTVMVGAFEPGKVEDTIGAKKEALYVIPVGVI